MQAPVVRFENDLRPLVSDDARGYLLAVSGGCDSTALLRLFVGLREVGSPLTHGTRIVVGHVHHGIRQGDADDDMRFVEELARTHELECVTARVDVPGERTVSRESLESTARALRYETFARWSVNLDLDTVVTAHHADDQIETVLFRIARGTGLRGLAGIPARRALHDGIESTRGGAPPAAVVRPLLDWSREEIREYLEHVGQSDRADRTNADTTIPRNALRHEVLPALEGKVHPGSRASILRLARTALQWQHDLDILIDEHWQTMHRAATDAPADLRLDLAGFLKVPETLQSAILVRAFDTVSRRVGHAYPALVESRLREITRRLGDGRIGREDDIELGAGWRVEVRDGELRVTYGVAPQEQEQQERSAPRPLPVTLPIPGEVRWGEWTVRVEVNVSAPDLPTTDPWSEIIDLDALAGRPIVVRGRQSGDRVHPLGASGSKPLKEFFRECSVLPENRDHAALVATCDTPSEIIWVPGKRLAHPFRVTENTTRRGRMVCRPPTDVPTE